MNYLVKTSIVLMLLLLISSVNAGDPFLDFEQITGPRAGLIGLFTPPNSNIPSEPFCGEVSPVAFRCIASITSSQANIKDTRRLTEVIGVAYGPTYTTTEAGIKYVRDMALIDNKLMAFIQKRIKPVLELGSGDVGKHLEYYYNKTEYGDLVKQRKILANKVLSVVSSQGSQPTPAPSPSPDSSLDKDPKTFIPPDATSPPVVIPPDPSPATNTGTIEMLTPDGKGLRKIPIDQVERYKAVGYEPAVTAPSPDAAGLGRPATTDPTPPLPAQPRWGNPTGR
jgi:hypothetical protein